MVTARVWWLGIKQINSSLGIGHSSADFTRVGYVTWLGASGTSSSVSKSAQSSSVTKSIAQGSESSSAVDALDDFKKGTHTYANDQITFGVDCDRTVQIDAHSDLTPFGLRDSDEVRDWWNAQRQDVAKYRAVSTDNNCNAMVAAALLKANGALYAPPPEFSLFAGANKVIVFADAIRVQVTKLQATWRKLQAICALQDNDGDDVWERRQWDLSAAAQLVPDVSGLLPQFHGALTARDRLERLRQIAEMLYQSVPLRGAAPATVADMVRRAGRPAAAPVAAVAPAAPPLRRGGARIVPDPSGRVVHVQPVRQAAVPLAAANPAVADPYAEARVFANIVRNRMRRIERDTARAT